VIGLVLAAFISSFTPLEVLIKERLQVGLDYFFALILGLVMYICATASVPLVHALISQGVSNGAGLILLLVGPITNYGAILMIRKEFGVRILLVYLGVICSLSVLAGMLFSHLFGGRI
jgi:hypothetical protein